MAALKREDAKIQLERELNSKRREFFDMQLRKNILGTYGNDNNTSFQTKLDQLRKDIDRLLSELSNDAHL